MAPIVTVINKKLLCTKILAGNHYQITESVMIMQKLKQQFETCNTGDFTGIFHFYLRRWLNPIFFGIKQILKQYKTSGRLGILNKNRILFA